jgi:hypothetical protein
LFFFWCAVGAWLKKELLKMDAMVLLIVAYRRGMSGKEVSLAWLGWV